MLQNPVNQEGRVFPHRKDARGGRAKAKEGYWGQVTPALVLKGAGAVMTSGVKCSLHSLAILLSKP